MNLTGTRPQDVQRRLS